MALMALERTFTHRIHALMKQVDRVTQDCYEGEAGIPAHEGRCLTAIGSYPPLSVNDLAQHANLDKAQASRAAQSLAAKGLIDKTPGATDARSVALTLTPQGRQVWLRAMRLVTRRNHEMTACLSADERQMFDKCLDKLLAHVNAGTRQA